MKGRKTKPYDLFTIPHLHMGHPVVVSLGKALKSYWLESSLPSSSVPKLHSAFLLLPTTSSPHYAPKSKK